MAEEEDYMGDLSQFLPPETSFPPTKPLSQKASNSKTKTLTVQSSNKTKPKFSNWQDQRKLKREKQQSVEDQQTLTNIQESVIPQTNIGFKMLKQMGYTPGSSLGKEGLGRAEPIGLEIRRGRLGLGREDPEKERKRNEEMRGMRKRVMEEELMAEFGCRVKEHWRSRRVVVNFRKAKGVLEQLENKEVVVEEKKDDDEEGGDDEEEEEVITEEDLQELLMKLRDEFHYCLFCGCQYESMEALLLNCPGIDEDDH